MAKLPSRWRVRQRQDHPDLFDCERAREASKPSQAALWIVKRCGVSLSAARVMATGAGFGDGP